MSRLLSGLLLLVLLPVYQASAQDFASEKVVKDYMAAWNAHDAAAAAAFMSDNVIYYDATVGEPVSGRADAQAQIIQAFMTAAPDLVWEMRGPAISSPGHVAFEWVFSGTNTGPWADGTPGTNKTFQVFGVSYINLLDGKIAYQGDYYDALGFYRQLGLME